MEGRVSSDQDLKLGDTLRYYQRDSNAAKALLVRRLRCLAAYETANRNLEKARSKNKDVHAVSSTIRTKLNNSRLPILNSLTKEKLIKIHFLIIFTLFRLYQTKYCKIKKNS